MRSLSHYILRISVYPLIFLITLTIYKIKKSIQIHPLYLVLKIPNKLLSKVYIFPKSKKKKKNKNSIRIITTPIPKLLHISKLVKKLLEKRLT